MTKLRWLAFLMTVAILAITGFQGYWLKNNYDREKQALELKTSTAFRETILKLQSSKLRVEDWMFRFDSVAADRKSKVRLKRRPEVTETIAVRRREPEITVINLLQEKLNDSLRSDSSRSLIISYDVNNMPPHLFDSLRRTRMPMPGKTIMDFERNQVRQMIESDSNLRMQSFPVQPAHGNGRIMLRPMLDTGEQNDVFKFLYTIDSLSREDSISITELNEGFKSRLKSENLSLPFFITRLDSTDKLKDGDVTVGFAKPVSYRLSLNNPFSFILKKLTFPLLFSIFLVGISILSFILLYRSLIRQQRLVELKNDFVSNVTHELKTPIATMGVAIEALKNFNALNDTQKTNEYLDISQHELQRLSLLVDKVLKLSMFGRKEMELKFEKVNLREITEEVLTSMRLQIEKANARIDVVENGNLNVHGDKIHLLSVIFNLVDNALKYTDSNPGIKIELQEDEASVLFRIADNGIGISREYKSRVFDKFFRVPSGNLHNAKGYGLGLSYAFEVIRKHKGSIKVESEPGKGSSFYFSLPKEKK